MNTIEFKVEIKKGREWAKPYYVASILIDGVDFLEIMKKKEKELNPSGAEELSDGYESEGYESLHPLTLYSNLTEENTEFAPTIILECICGCDGCDDFFIEIKENTRTVLWSNFCYVYGKGEYAEFKFLKKLVFKFNKKDYCQALRKLNDETKKLEAGAEEAKR